MSLFRASLLVVMSCAVMSAQAANFNNSSGKTNSTRFTNKIPEGSSPTLKQMQLAYLSYFNKGYSRPGYLIEPAGTPVEIKASISKDEKVTRELRSTGLMSYLLYRQGQLVVDEISPSDRLGKFITNDTPLNSQSIGKSLT